MVQAGMVFSFLFADWFSNLRERFESKGLSVELPWDPQSLSGFWPDQMLCVSLQTRPLPTPSMSLGWTILHCLSWTRRLWASFFKLEAIAMEVIEECVSATLALENQCLGLPRKRPTLPLHSELWPEARLRLISTYKHVGGVIPAGGGCARELTARVGAAWLAFRKHKRQVLASPIVSAKDKAVLFAALVEPALWLEHGRPVKTKSLCASRAPW